MFKTQVLTLLTLIMLACFVVACGDGDIVKTYEFEEIITHVEVANESGNLCIEPSSDDVTVVDVDMSYSGRRPELDVQVVDETLYVYLDCDRRCDGIISLRIPADASLWTDTPSGNVAIRDLENEVTARVYTGNLTAERLSGSPLTLETSYGNIRGTALTSPGGFAQTYVGQIYIDFDDETSDVIARTHTGDIKMTVLSGSYDMYTEIGAGQLTLDGVEYDSSSSNRIQVLTNLGNIDILGI